VLPLLVPPRRRALLQTQRWLGGGVQREVAAVAAAAMPDRREIERLEAGQRSVEFVAAKPTALHPHKGPLLR
jgi:hypothetical protein